MSILGTEVRRLEDPRLLLGQGEFMADLSDPRLDGAVHLAFARSMYAHGEILEVDAAEALGMPGVIAVFTAADIDLVPSLPGGAGAPIEMARPWLATGRVRFVGEPVAVVVAETAVQAADAAEMVIVDVEPLPAVVGIERAGSDEDLLFPDVGSNVNSTMDDGWADLSDEELWEGCDVVVRATVVNQRLAALPLEGRGSAAFFVDGRLTQWVSTQAPHGCRTSLATAHGLGRHEVHVIAPDVGGGFGAKINPSPEDVLVGWVARRIGRPARWVETRSENLLAMSQGRDQVHDVAIGGTRDGRVLAYELDITADCGAYPLMGAFLPYFTRLMAPGVYDIERVRTRCRAVVTNTVPTEAFRGAGRPEAAATVERAMDLFAAEVGLDPAELRRRNLIPPERFPLTTPSGAAYDNGEYEQSLDLALETADYAGLRAEQQKRRDAGDVTQLGIGVAMYVEITGAGVTTEFGGVRLGLDDDGEVSATVLTGASPHGQGLVTSYTMLASDRLGIPMERISVVHGDTDEVSWGFGTMGSRSLQIGGSAVLSAADGVIDAARELAATELEAAPADIVLDTASGAFHVAGTPARSVPWARVVRAAADSMSSGASTDGADTDGADTDGATRTGIRCGSKVGSTPPASPFPSAATSRWSRSTPRRAAPI